jgi:hypothetical protein
MELEVVGWIIWLPGSCEHNNEPPGSIKGREFLGQLSVLSVSQGLCFMELVNAFLYGIMFLHLISAQRGSFLISVIFMYRI